MGTADLLFPPGVTDLRELPGQYFEAIRMSLTFLSFEELPSQDQPPRRIWLDPERLKEHFEAVKARHKEETGSEEDAIDEPVRNAAARDLVAR